MDLTALCLLMKMAILLQFIQMRAVLTIQQLAQNMQCFMKREGLIM